MSDHFGDLTPEIACEALKRAGIFVSPEEVEVSARDERWTVSLPGERIAWFPASELGGRRLSVERRVLRLLADRCSFQVPRLLFVSESGFDVRLMVPGRCDPWSLFERCKKDWTLAQHIGRSIGLIVAEQHTKIDEADVTGWLPQFVSWPVSGDWVRERLRRVVNDDDLAHAIERIIERYETTTVDASDRVLVHSDIGLHNLALDPESDNVNGIFDYDSAAWADRHHDFRYLLFDVAREDMLEAALEIYEPEVGRMIDRDRVRLYNAACAVSFLAFRVGTAPDRKSCGRTLAEDLRWVRTALSKLAR